MKLIVAKAKEKFKSSNTVNSSVWVAGGMASSQIIRLLSNLILTRLLVPEYFGIMAIVQSILGFFLMMTDVGLLPSIINTKRDKDSVFMRTVWTVQVLKASLISILVLIVSYPISVIYEEPLLFPVLAFTAFTSLIGGFNSVSLLIEQKYIRQKSLVINQVLSQVAGAVVMIVLAYFTNSIWALVIGNFISVALVLWFSYRRFSEHYSLFLLDRQALSELINFGKWIFLSSLFSYFSMRVTPLLLGIWLSLSQLGVFTIALTLSAVIEGVANAVSMKILSPRYRQLIESKDYFSISKLRFKYIIIFLVPTVLLGVIGQQLVSTLYDERYSWASVIIQILVIGRIFRIFEHTAKPVLAPLGDSKSLMYTQAISAFSNVSIIWIVGVNYSIDSLILTIALLPFLDYVIVRVFVLKHNVFMFNKDFSLIAVSLSSLLFFWYLFGMAGWSFLNNLFG